MIKKTFGRHQNQINNETNTMEKEIEIGDKTITIKCISTQVRVFMTGELEHKMGLGRPTIDPTSAHWEL